MSLTYAKLRNLIAHKVGWAPGLASSEYSADTRKAAVVESILERGLSKFYDPPIMTWLGQRDKHRWRFLTPVLTTDLIAGQWRYDLPPGFVDFTGELNFVAGEADFWPALENVGPDEIMKRVAMTDDQSTPTAFGVRVKASHAVHKIQYELLVHPVPSESVQVEGLAKINPAVPGATGDVPFGGQPHENTIIEACLSEAVAMVDDLDDGGRSENRFREFLAASVSHDLSTTGARVLPKNLDPGLGGWDRFTWAEALSQPGLTYLGQEW